MHADYERLRDDYIRALRPVVVDVLRWWDAHSSYSHTDERHFGSKEPFHQRWRTGPAGHPRIIAVLREYWLQVLDLNARFAGERDEAQARGEDIPPDAVVHYQRPIDLLVEDLSRLAPDLFDVMQGMLYIPIGIHPGDGLEC